MNEKLKLTAKYLFLDRTTDEKTQKLNEIVTVRVKKNLRKRENEKNETPRKKRNKQFVFILTNQL